MEETVQQTIKIKEEKISSLEKKVDESNTVNATLVAELASVRACITVFKMIVAIIFYIYFFS